MILFSLTINATAYISIAKCVTKCDGDVKIQHPTSVCRRLWCFECVRRASSARDLRQSEVAIVGDVFGPFISPGSLQQSTS